MFYVKEKIGENLEVRINIEPDNVFTKCPVCGTEFTVDVQELVVDGDADLYTTTVFCDECSRKI